MPSRVAATLAISTARAVPSTSPAAGRRIRSEAGRSRRAISSRTAACSSTNPSKPSLAASRTTVAPLVSDRRATSATVPKATASGSSATIAATRRSAGVSRGRCASICAETTMV